MDPAFRSTKTPPVFSSLANYFGECCEVQGRIDRFLHPPPFEASEDTHAIWCRVAIRTHVAQEWIELHQLRSQSLVVQKRINEQIENR